MYIFANRLCEESQFLSKKVVSKATATPDVSMHTVSDLLVQHSVVRVQLEFSNTVHQTFL